MATSDERPAYQRLLNRKVADFPEVPDFGPGDLGRVSIEAMVSQADEVRDLASNGAVRISGAGVFGHAADLESVGKVATTWQRLVTAIGAALEGSKGAFGRIPLRVENLTRLNLAAAPGEGSIVLRLTPASNPQVEAAPDGVRSMFDAPRPLADRASEALAQLFADVAAVGPDADALAAELQFFGPRVGSALRSFTDIAFQQHFDIDFEWREPEQPTRRANMSAGTAGWLRDFVDGRDLDAMESVVEGTVRTVSDISKWSIETADGMRHIDASQLDPDVVRATTVGQAIRLLVLMRVRERPDGTSTQAIQALRPLSPEIDPTS